MNVSRLTVDEVKGRMDRGEPIFFIDTRNPKAWEESPDQLPGALRLPADAVEQHLKEIPHDRAIVTYCT